MTAPLRILAITSQFPCSGDPTRGRPLQQTLAALGGIAQVRVASPVARYPQRLRPRSYLFARAEAAYRPDGCGDVGYVDYPTVPLVGRLTNGIACAGALRREVRAFRPDLLLAYWLYPDAYAAIRLGAESGLPVVAGARGSDLRVRDPLSRWFTRRVVARADRLIVVSEDLAAVAEKQYAADPAHVRVVPNGCDSTLFRLRDRDRARTSLGLPRNARLVLYAGRLVPEKGLRELLAAMEMLPGPDWMLVLVGDGPMQPEIRGIAGSARHPVFMVGSQPPPQVARWMAAADVVALPSYSEGYPNVLVEALACGRPVVATRVGGIPEIVDATNGLLVPARDAGALAQALEAAATRQWDAAALAGRFSRGWDTVARETLDACRDALVRHRARRRG